MIGLRNLTAGLWVVGLLGGLLAADEVGKQIWNFDGDRSGALPRGFTAEVGEWKVVNDGGNQVLAQQAQSPDAAFNLVLIDDTLARDVDLSVRLKAVEGQNDQGGGLVWRAKDKKNYYIARYNPLEDNYRVYKVVEGRRIMLQSAEIAHTPGWHTLRVTMKADRIECFYDGKKYLEAQDTTFPDAGKIGLWSKADARSYFDDLILVDSSRGSGIPGSRAGWRSNASGARSMTSSPTSFSPRNRKAI
jgi:hypothetical protein